MKEATVCYPVRGLNGSQEILLGERVSLFANGRWNGPGGKMTPWERANGIKGVRRCLRREVRQETSVLVDHHNASLIASVDFHHLVLGEHRLEWRVHFFTVESWQGEFRPVEGFSRFEWFPRCNLPYDRMMPDRKFWFPMAFDHLASGKVLQASIFYGDTEQETVQRGTFDFIEQSRVVAP